MTKSVYTGGSNGWGTMQVFCAICGELIAEYECDEQGLWTDCIFDEVDEHICEE